MKDRHTKLPRIKATARGRGECRAIFAALSGFLDGTLPAENCQELRRHVIDCKPCVEYLDSLKRTIDLCHAYETGVAPPPSPQVRKAFKRALSTKRT